MSFISVLLALLLEQARPLAPGNLIHASVRAWVRWSTSSFDAGKLLHGWLTWGFSVGVPSLSVLLVYWLCKLYLASPIAVIWSVVVLYATLGFRQFSFHFTQIRDALADGDENLARDLLASWQHIDANALPRSEIVRHAIEYSVLAAHRHVFGVLVWFSVLAAFGFGPAGAVLYRVSEFVTRYWQHQSKAHHQPVSEALRLVALKAWEIIDWLPARVTALSFAVVGSFEETVDAWRSYARQPGGTNDGIILAATTGAVNIKLGDRMDTADQVSDGAPEMPNASPLRQMPEAAHLAIIVGLVWRTVVMWMVLLALLTLARLLG